MRWPPRLALDIETAGRQRAAKAVGDRVLYEGTWCVGDSEISWRVGTVSQGICNPLRPSHARRACSRSQWPAEAVTRINAGAHVLTSLTVGGARTRCVCSTTPLPICALLR